MKPLAPYAMANQLTAALAAHEQLVERRARQIAGPLIEQARLQADLRVAELEDEHAWDRQRHEDLVAEFRRQMRGWEDVRIRHAAHIRACGWKCPDDGEVTS